MFTVMKAAGNAAFEQGMDEVHVQVTCRVVLAYMLTVSKPSELCRKIC